MNPRALLAPLTLLMALPVALQADTLYLRNGSRIQGELVGIRNGTIEFEERRGFGGTRTVDVHVRRLRAKLGPEFESQIDTVRNVGYKFNAAPNKESADLN